MQTVKNEKQISFRHKAFGLPHAAGVCVFLLLLVFLTYGKALFGNFLADEAWYLPIVTRGYHGEPDLIWRQFLAPYTYHESLYVMYRPLVVFSYVVDYFFWMVDPFGFHLTNLFLHLANACLVFWTCRLVLLYLLLNDDKESRLDQGICWKIPLMVSTAFAVYPGQTEPACWIMTRIDTMASAFYFASIGSTLKYLLVRRKLWFHIS